MRGSLVTLLAAIGLLVAAPAAAGVRPAIHPVTPAGPSTYDDVVTPLAGSAQILVFARQVHRSGDSNEANTGLGKAQAGGISIAYARQKSGHTISLGVFPPKVTTQVGEWSTAGHWVAAGDYGYDYPVARTAYLWNLRTAKRHTITLGRHDTYLTVSRLGLVYLTKSSEVRIRRFDGTVLSLGHPFGSLQQPSVSYAFGAAGQDGVAVSLGGDTKYIRLASPHTVTALDRPGDAALACQQVGTTYAACSDVDGDGGYYRPSNPVLLPLDGSAATVPTPTWDDGDDALLGSDTIAWWVDGQVFTQKAGATTATTTSLGGPGLSVAGAYGAVFTDSTQVNALEQLAPNGSTSVAIKPRRSPVTVDNFALAPDRVVYSDDQQVPSRAGVKESAFIRTLSRGASKVRQSSARLISTGTASVTGNLIAASDAVAVYATDQPPLVGDLPASLHIVSASGVTTIPSVVGYGLIQAWHHEVLYQQQHDTIDVFDAATRRTSTVLSPAGIDNDAIALWGHYISYATQRGTIIRKNFLSGRKTVLAPAPTADIGALDIAVYAHGDWVGWARRPGSDIPGHAASFLVNVATGGRPIRLPHTLYSLTSAGALLATHHTTAHDEERVAEELTDGVFVPAIRIWLRSYAGQITPLLSPRHFVAGPQIAGGMLAWAGQDGVLRIRPL